MRIRKRLALYGAFVIGLAMFVFAVLLNLLAGQGAPDDQQQSLEELVAHVEGSLVDLDRRQLSGSSPLFSADLGVSLDPFVAVYDETGEVLYATGLVAGVPPQMPAAVLVEALQTGASTAPIRPSPDIELRVVAAGSSLRDGTPVVVVAGQSAEFVEQQLIGLRVVIWAAAIITLIGATIASWLVSGRALRPLRDLVATTDEIGKTGDLGRRLPRVKADDEVGRLAESFNTMLGTVESSQSRLSEALAAQRRFVADASHELRGPLTTIRANAGFLRDRKDVSEDDRAEAVGDISTQSDRMSRLVDDLLLLAGADAGARIVKSPVDLTALVADVERAMHRLDRPISVARDGPLVVEGDEEALGRLVWILVENADKHGAGQITVTLGKRKESAQVAVTDDGPGFPDHELDRVFERFYRGDPARSPAGSGLGLAIAREIVIAHGGTIAADNRAGGGARVTVSLPAI